MQSMMIQLEPECQRLGEAFLQMLACVRAQQPVPGAAVDYERIEEEVAQHVAAMEREAHAIVLGRLEVEAEHVLIEGQLYRRVMRSPGTYYTMAGPVVVERTLYRKVGERNGATVDAISLRAGVLGDGWLPGTARVMAWECQRAPSREAEQAGQKWQRLPYSRSAFESVAHLVGGQCGLHREVVERELVETMEIPKQAHSVSVSLDRVSIPMEEPRSPNPPSSPVIPDQSAERQPVQEPLAEPGQPPKKKKPKRLVQRVFRQAYAGTVTLHDAKGNALYTMRYGRMPKGDIEGLCTAMSDDVMMLLRRCPALLVVLLCDGAKELWNKLQAEFTPSGLGCPIHRLVDLWHLLEKLGSAARLLYGPTEAAVVMGKWRLSLLNDDNAVEPILQTLKDSGKEHTRVGESRPVHEAITYLENHREDMKYAQARRLGLPVGSGNVEATCKSLFEVRLKRPGCRWKEETGAHIVDLRALGLSDRYDPALRLAMRPLRHAVSPDPASSAVLSCAG
jgi:hypothetical protein